jgi:hypothetical protein
VAKLNAHLRPINIMRFLVMSVLCLALNHGQHPPFPSAAEPIPEAAKIPLAQFVSKDPSEASRGAVALFALGETAIPGLMRLLDNREPYEGAFMPDYCNPYAIPDDPKNQITINIISLYLIEAIQLENISFASSMMLKRIPLNTNDTLDTSAQVTGIYLRKDELDSCIRSVKRWDYARRIVGLAWMRRHHYEPLKHADATFV